MTKYRIGCDIGGSFTDFILYEVATGKIETLKVATTPERPEDGLMNGIDALTKNHPTLPENLKVLIHGTTLVINAILERKGAKTALLTTEGFRDIIETRREIRYDIYDIRQEYPKPIVPRNLRIGTAGRIASDGSEVTPIDPTEVTEILHELSAQGIESVSVCFINAYANPAHEAQVAEIARDAGIDLSFSLSSDVLPEIREFERFTTTTLNAYVKPKVDKYLAGVERALSERGHGVPLYLMQSGGGVITAETARQSPVRLAESGPVGGVLAARNLARLAGHSDAIAFDMGGTTAKTCLIRKGEMPITRSYEVDRVHRFKRGSGTPLAVPTVDLIEIGAGGGSIAQVDTLGRLKVGPESAVADPGPACFGRGGTQPTVTDANLILGFLDPAEFAAGGIILDRDAAADAILREVADPLGLDVQQAAAAIIEIVNENMSQAARIYAAENAGDLTETAMVAFGGGGPLHAMEVARKLKIPKIIVPEAAGVFSALGFLMAAPSYEVARSYPRRLDEVDEGALTTVIGELRDQAGAIIAASAPDAAQHFNLFADLRYIGQGHQLRVPIDEIARGSIAENFAHAYLEAYGYVYDDMQIEIVTLRVEATADASGPQFTASDTVASAESNRTIWDQGVQAMVPHRVMRFDAITDRIDGPALIIQPGTSIHLGTGAYAERHALGWLEINTGV
ncbi:N-methylhydantoinase A [Monaibacterium marinum]|uniref:N-methylhydantoinase A n=1 Tax=Pontivivens marinum TaxID=1690039 RepID=A0A2C9CRY8_9RHOB|nr:hydantoinase/oxoprolinase family protein [Monaibacterium marinum]SOH94311.1 N-methylhydantoinase A [Monaibacterium marinum]